jgi:hypothetical protein
MGVGTKHHIGQFAGSEKDLGPNTTRNIDSQRNAGSLRELRNVVNKKFSIRTSGFVDWSIRQRESTFAVSSILALEFVLQIQ